MKTITQQHDEFLTEGVLSSLKDGYGSIKTFANNVGHAVDTHKQLRSLDGKKTFTTAALRDETIRIRNELQIILRALSPAISKKFQTVLARVKAESVDGVYLGRNYYFDFIVYTLIKPIASLAAGSSDGKVKKFVVDTAIDKLIGFLLVAVTGIPSIDDVKDVGDMAKSLAKASNNLANKINSFQPEQSVATESRVTFKKFIEVY